MLVPSIQNHLREFYFDAGDRPDPLGRYRSWEECHRFFDSLRRSLESNKTLTDDQLVHASLHLGFFLASWGMVRGSSNLLEHSYLVHRPVVETLLNSKYRFLWGFNPADKSLGGNYDGYIDSLLELESRFREWFESLKSEPISLTDVLFTKILLGSIACAPAYDRYFREGLRRAKLKPQSHWKHSLRAVVRFYLDHQGEFEDGRNSLEGTGRSYPPMKLVDMYFWQVGRKAS